MILIDNVNIMYDQQNRMRYDFLALYENWLIIASIPETQNGMGLMGVEAVGSSIDFKPLPSSIMNGFTRLFDQAMNENRVLSSGIGEYIWSKVFTHYIKAPRFEPDLLYNDAIKCIRNVEANPNSRSLGLIGIKDFYDGGTANLKLMTLEQVAEMALGFQR